MTTPPLSPSTAADTAVHGHDADRREWVSLRLRLTLTTLGIAPLDIGFTDAFLAVSGRWEAVPYALALNAGLLVVLNGLVTWLIVSPIRHIGSDASENDRQWARHRLRIVGLLIPVWTFVLGPVYCAAVFLSGLYVANTGTLMDGTTAALAFLWFAFVYGFYFAFYAYFAITDAIASYRLRYPDTLTTRLNQPMAIKFALIALALAVMPAAQILQDLTWLSDVRTLQGITSLDAVMLDLMATSIAVALSLFFVARHLLRPIGNLVGGLEQVATGDLRVRLTPLSDDEMGDISDRFNMMVHGLAERRRVEEMFSKYVAPSVAKSLLSNSEDGTIRTERQIVTNLFADIEGFTTLSEDLDPSYAIDMLNEYFETISAPITSEGGAIVNLTGNGLHAVFNLPVRIKGHANAAVRAAREIQRVVQGRRFGPGEGHILKTRIGIHTGPVVAGSVGCDDRLHYTVYGDSVNTASRLEGMNKHLGTSTLISEQVLEHLGDHGKSLPLKRFVDQPIRGRQHTMTLYAIDPPTDSDEINRQRRS